MSNAPHIFGWREMAAPVLSLFTSMATLICCALPALMVALGMGAVLAGLVSDVPQLVWLSRHKGIVFGAAAVMVAVAGIMLWRARNLPCPADPGQARACALLRRVSVVIYGVSVLALATGAFFAFAASALFAD